MDICVIGAGYVGLVTSACFAYFHHRVVTVESDSRKLSALKSGSAPVFEPGLEEMVASGAADGLLEFEDDLNKGVRDSEIIFITVGTPSLPGGEPDLSQVMTVARGIGSALDRYRGRYIVNKSTVPVGSGNWVEMLITQGLRKVETVPARASKAEMPEFDVVSNPEFLREGTAISDSLYPDRIVVGCHDEKAVEKMKELYAPIINQNFEPPSYAPRPAGKGSVPFVVTDLPSAEMIKYSANAFLAMKISFANEIASVCEKVGADVLQVVEGIGLDKRIGASFLNAGIGWGGSCFNKDVSALIQVAQEYHCPTELLESTISVNARQRLSVITKLQEELKILKGRTIGLMGLAFKPNTDDLRDAPSLTIASQLIKMGAEVKAYDPVTNARLREVCPELEVICCKDLEELAAGADGLVLVTEWEEFRHVDWKKIGALMREQVIIDGRNLLAGAEMEFWGFRYRGVGR